VNLQCINVSVSVSSDGLCYPCFPNDDTPLKGLWHTSAVAVGRTANHPASSLRVGNEATKSIWRAAQSRTRVMTWRDVAWFKGWPFDRLFYRNNLEYLRVAVWGAGLPVTARDTLLFYALLFSCILESMVEVKLPLFLIIHPLIRCLVVLLNRTRWRSVANFTPEPPYPRRGSVLKEVTKNKPSPQKGIEPQLSGFAVYSLFIVDLPYGLSNWRYIHIFFF